MPSEQQEIIDQARHWLQLDPENAGVLEREITAALDGDDAARATLAARFAGYLTFGTAGLRAPLGPGTTRMNRVVVQRAAAGIADFALSQVTEPFVVIGYDARHGSQQFALDSAAVLTAAGCRVQLLEIPVPTPVLAFALKRHLADVGIMVTASHNPPTDNGYKVYLGPRLDPSETAPGAYAQITAPTDQPSQATFTHGTSQQNFRLGLMPGGRWSPRRSSPTMSPRLPGFVIRYVVPRITVQPSGWCTRRCTVLGQKHFASS